VRRVGLAGLSDDEFRDQFRGAGPDLRGAGRVGAVGVRADVELLDQPHRGHASPAEPAGSGEGGEPGLPPFLVAARAGGASSGEAATGVQSHHALTRREADPGPVDRVPSSYSTQLAYDWAPCDAVSSIGMLQRVKHPARTTAPRRRRDEVGDAGGSRGGPTAPEMDLPL
jgi:hypothetical protein